ncbi:DoxX family protein [Actinophytocola sediminis]
METGYLLVALVTVAVNAFSGIAAITRFTPVMRTLRPALATVGVPESWLVFPIGVLKVAGAAGVLLGALWAPPLGTAAAIGLVLYYVCAVYTHVRVGDYRFQFGLATGFLALAVATLSLDLALR